MCLKCGDVNTPADKLCGDCYMEIKSHNIAPRDWVKEHKKDE